MYKWELAGSFMKLRIWDFGSADDIWKIFAILFINLLIP